MAPATTGELIGLSVEDSTAAIGEPKSSARSLPLGPGQAAPGTIGEVIGKSDKNREAASGKSKTLARLPPCWESS